MFYPSTNTSPDRLLGATKKLPDIEFPERQSIIKGLTTKSLEQLFQDLNCCVLYHPETIFMNGLHIPEAFLITFSYLDFIRRFKEISEISYISKQYLPQPYIPGTSSEDWLSILALNTQLFSLTNLSPVDENQKSLGPRELSSRLFTTKNGQLLPNMRETENNNHKILTLGCYTEGITPVQFSTTTYPLQIQTVNEILGRKQ
jgi:hypothetical protein